MRRTPAIGDEMCGIRLRNKRIERGLRLVDVAQAAGVSASLLSRIETGKRVVHRSLLNRLAEALGESPESLAGPCAADDRRPSARVESHWPTDAVAIGSMDQRFEAVQVADLALRNAMRDALAIEETASPVERFRACKGLAALASRPLEALFHISRDDSDPAVRAAAQQLLSTLNDAYSCSAS